MNKIYKVIWSKARQCYVVVSEYAKSQSKSAQTKKIFAALMAAGIAAGVGIMPAEAKLENVNSNMWGDDWKKSIAAVEYNKDKTKADSTTGLYNPYWAHYNQGYWKKNDNDKYDYTGTNDLHKGNLADCNYSIQRTSITIADLEAMNSTHLTNENYLWNQDINRVQLTKDSSNNDKGTIALFRNNNTQVNEALTVEGTKNAGENTKVTISMPEYSYTYMDKDGKAVTEKAAAASISLDTGSRVAADVVQNSDKSKAYYNELTNKNKKALTINDVDYTLAVSHDANGNLLSSDAIANSVKNSIALGIGATAGGSDSETATSAIAIGEGAGASADNTIAIGHKAAAGGNYSVAIGSGTDEGKGASSGSVAIGGKDTVAGNHSIAIGVYEEGYKSGSQRSSGYTSATGTYSIAIGLDAVASSASDSMAFGRDSSSTVQEGIAIGYKAQQTSGNAVGGVALGSYSAVDSNRMGNSYYYGWDPLQKNSDGSYGGVTTDANKTASQIWVANKGSVSVGGWIDGASDKTYVTRQITYVAAGSQDTDAVNVAQLKQLKTYVDQNSGNGSWNLETTTGETTSTTIGNTNTVTMTGANGIEVTQEAKAENKGSNLTIKLDDETKTNIDASVKYDVTKNDDGTTTINKNSITLEGEDGTTITNLKAGDISATSTDAVNGSQLFATNQNVTNNTTNITTLQGQVIKSGTIGTDGKITLNTAGENTANITLDGTLHDSKVVQTGTSYDATTGTITVTSQDQYDSSKTSSVKIEDIASKSKLDDVDAGSVKYVKEDGSYNYSKVVLGDENSKYNSEKHTGGTSLSNVSYAETDNSKTTYDGSAAVNVDLLKNYTSNNDYYLREGGKLAESVTVGEKTYTNGYKVGEDGNIVLSVENDNGTKKDVLLTDVASKSKVDTLDDFAVKYDKNKDGSVNYNSVTMGEGKEGTAYSYSKDNDGKVTTSGGTSITNIAYAEADRTSENYKGSAAVNVDLLNDQITGVNDKITNATFGLTDDNGGAVTAKVNNTISVKGEDGITSTVKEGGLVIGLDDSTKDTIDRAVKYDTKVVEGKTVVDHDKITLGSDTAYSRTVDEETEEVTYAGGTSITNIAYAEADRTSENYKGSAAVNVDLLNDQITGVNDKITNATFGLTDDKGMAVTNKVNNTISVKGNNGVTSTVKGEGENAYLEIGLSNKITLGEKGENGKDGAIEIVNKDGTNTTITITKDGKPGVDGKDGETTTRIVYGDKQVATMDDGLKFAGDTGDVSKVKLNNTVTVSGGITDTTKLSDNNIGVVSDGKGGLNVKLAKDVKVDSVTTGNTVVNNDGVTITKKTGEGEEAKTVTVSLTDGGLNNGGNKIVNVANGNVTSTSTDAVNGSQLYEVKTLAGKHTNVTVEGGKTATAGGDYVGDSLKLKVTDNDGQLTYDVKLGNQITVGEKGENGKDGEDGKITIVNKDGTNTSITITKDGKPGVDGKDGETTTRIVYGDKQVATMDDGLKFAGDTGDVSKVKLNNTVTVSGGITDTTKLSDNNIGVVSDGKGGLNVKLAKDVKVDSVTTGNTVVNNDGVTITKKTGEGEEAKTVTVSLTDGGLNNGGNKIVNVANGDVTSTSTDAVNGSQLYEVKTLAGKHTNVTVEGGKTATAGGDYVGDSLKLKVTDNDGQLTYDVKLGNQITVGEKGENGKDGEDGKITIVNKDGTNTSITITKDGKPGVDGKDGETTTRIVYGDKQVATMDDGLKFAGDTGDVSKVKLNNTVTVSGGITDTTKLSDNNIGVVSDGKGGLNVKLAKDVKVDSVTTGNTVVNNDGVTITKKTGEGEEAKTVTVSLTDGGLNNGGNKIVNVAKGDVTSTSTDAVNGSQLYEVKTLAGKHTNVTVEGGKTATAGGDYVGDSLKLKVTDNDGQLTYDVKLGNQITVGEKGENGKDGENGKITIVNKDGTNTSITITKDGKPGVDGKDGETTTRIVYGDKQVATMDDGLKFAGDTGDVSKVKLNNTVTVSGGITDTTKLSDNNIGVVSDGKGGLNVKLAKDVKVDSVTTGNTVVNNDGVTITKKTGEGEEAKTVTVSLTDGGLNNGGNKIVNVANGDVTSTSTDAVNGSQLYEVKTLAGKHTNVTVEGGKTATAGGDYVGDSLKLKVTDNDGQLTYDVKLGNQITVGEKGENGKDGEDGKITIINKDGTNTSITITKDGKPSVDGKDGETTTRIVYGDKQVATMDDGLKFVGDDGQTIAKKLNETLGIKGGVTESDKLSTNANVGVVKDENGDLKIELAKNINLGEDGSVTTGNTVVNTNGITITKNGKTVSLTDGGLNNGGNKITNVAAGTDDTDAVNVSQLNKVKEDLDDLNKGAVKYYKNKDGSYDYSKVILGDEKNVYNKTEKTGGTTISNVSYATVDKTNTSYDGSAAVNVDLLIDQIDAAKQEAKDSDQHVKAGTYAVGEVTVKDSEGKESKAQGVSMDIVNGKGEKTGTVTITDVAKASDMGKISDLKDNVKNADGSKTTVVDAINNLSDKVGDTQYKHSDGSSTTYVTAGEDVTKSIGKLDEAIGKAAETAKKHTTVTNEDGNITISETTNKDGGKNYEVGLNKEKIDLGKVTIEGENGKITAKEITSDKATIGDVSIENNTVSGLSNTKWEAAKADKDVSEGGYKGSTKAATESQLQQAMDGAVQYDRNEDGTVNKSKVTLAGGEGGTTITNVKAGDISATSTDAVNGSQLHATNQQVAQNTVNINKLGNRVARVGAGAAALAALHPLDFDPDAKWDFAAGYGNYRGANAAAIGAYYRPNEDLMFSVGASVGGGENMVNAGVSVKLGAGSSHVNTSKVAMAKEIKELRGTVAEQSAQIAKLTELVNALVGVERALPYDKGSMFPDVPENHWAYEAVDDMIARGLIEGYPDGTFGGDRNLTRYEFAMIVHRALLRGAEVSEQLQQEFAGELKYFTVDTVKEDKNGDPEIQRVRTVKENIHK